MLYGSDFQGSVTTPKTNRILGQTPKSVKHPRVMQNPLLRHCKASAEFECVLFSPRLLPLQPPRTVRAIAAPSLLCVTVRPTKLGKKVTL